MKQQAKKLMVNASLQMVVPVMWLGVSLSHLVLLLIVFVINHPNENFINCYSAWTHKICHLSITPINWLYTYLPFGSPAVYAREVVFVLIEWLWQFQYPCDFLSHKHYRESNTNLSKRLSTHHYFSLSHTEIENFETQNRAKVTQGATLC